MRFRFLGGAEEIGRLGCVIEEDDGRVLLDYGLAPETPPAYPDPPPTLDAVLLTHAHLDHSGMLPALTHQGDLPVWCTDPTRKVANILHHDTIKIADIEGYPRPFTPDMVEHAATRFRDARPGEEITAGPFSVTPRLAGHIPGALQYHITLPDGRTALFTGDLYTESTRLVEAAKPVGADVLFIESTYAGRKHPDRAAEEERFARRVRETVERGGVALVPAFATGRCQEVLLTLAAKTDLDIWVDGMGARVLDIFLSHPEYVRDRRALRDMRARVHLVRNHRQRKHASNVGEVIVATSGMLDGGPILYYIEQHRRDARSSVCLTGFQVPGTNGRKLLDERLIRDRGLDIAVHMEVDKFDLSTHLDHEEIVRYVKQVGAEDVILYHGFDRERLVPDLEPMARVHLPMRGDEVTL